MATQRSAPLDDRTLRARIAALARAPAARALAAVDAGAHRVLLVGGALRDAALGAAVSDLDAIARAGGCELAESLARHIGGRVVRLAPGRFAAWRVVGPDFEVDLWDLEGGALAADLARRDLTINAIALDLGNGEILDPHQGLADLVRGQLRAVRAGTFAEDPLRVLRLARFAVTLEGFEIDPATAVAARAAAPGLDRVAGERIREELAALTARERPVAAQRALVEAAVYPGLWRGFSVADPSPQDGIAAFSRLERARAQLAAADPLDERIATEHALRLALAVAPGRLGPALTGLGRRAVLTRIQARAIRALLEAAPSVPPRGDELARKIWGLGTRWAGGLALAAALAPAADEAAWAGALDEARERVAERGDALVAPRPLVAGEEAAVLLGVAPGPELGAALEALLEAQVLGKVGSIESARSFLIRRARRAED